MPSAFSFNINKMNILYLNKFSSASYGLSIVKITNISKIIQTIPVILIPSKLQGRFKY